MLRPVGGVACLPDPPPTLTAVTASAQPVIDSQQVEIVGRNLLISLLVSSGIEVARPERDRGVDLIAYLDLDVERGFQALPLQLKAFSARGMSVNRKYERLSDLHVVYAWHVREPAQAEFFCLSTAEAVAVANEMGWTRTESWRKGVYTTNSPPVRLVALLEPYRVTTAEHWLHRVRRTADRTAP